jgi:hypothetical protein
LTHLKIKLNGDDLTWDIQRVIGVDAACEIEQRRRGVSKWFYSLDFNEKCANVAYLLEFLHAIRERIPAARVRARADRARGQLPACRIYRHVETLGTIAGRRMKFVLDSSVAVTWYLREADTEGAETAF